MFCKYLHKNGLGHTRPVSDGAELQTRLVSSNMATLREFATSSSDCPGLPSSYWEPLWYAAYTSANHEKHVAKQLVHKSVEHFLPLYQTVRWWKDRRVQLQRPLFPGYIFVRLPLHDRLQVLQVHGVSKLVGFNGTPSPLPHGEIDALRTSLATGVSAEPHPSLTVGRRVWVKSGPLTGMRGILIRKNNKDRLVISLELILRSVAVEVSALEVEST